MNIHNPYERINVLVSLGWLPVEATLITLNYSAQHENLTAADDE